MTLERARLLGCALLAAQMGWTPLALTAASLDVEFINTPSVTMTAPPAPTPLSLDQTFSVASGSGHAIIHDAPGKLELGGLVQANAGGAGTAGLTEDLEDVLRFSGLPGPTPITDGGFAVTGALPAIPEPSTVTLLGPAALLLGLALRTTGLPLRD
jgi:hypothetical protein